MTRKDYVLIAKVLNETKIHNKSCSCKSCFHYDEVVHQLAIAFKENNSKFDVEKFKNACNE